MTRDSLSVHLLNTYSLLINHNSRPTYKEFHHDG